MNDFEALCTELLENRDVRVAATENQLRNKLSSVVFSALGKSMLISGKGVPLPDIASKLGVSEAQLSLLLQVKHGGQLSLKTLVRVADVLGLQLDITLQPKKESNMLPQDSQSASITTATRRAHSELLPYSTGQGQSILSTKPSNE